MDRPAYQLEMESHGDVLRARVWGAPDTLEVSMAYWSEVLAACEARGISGLLVVDELEGPAQAADMEAVVEGLLAMGFRDKTVAYVNAREDAARLVNAEIRAQDQGLRARVFRREPEAAQWLAENVNTTA